MRVWITRTEPGAQRLALALAERGFAVFKAPVLRIEASDELAPQGPFDLVLYVSEAAVAEAVLRGGGAWRSSPAIAIGAPTAVALCAAGIELARPWQRHAEDVVQSLEAMPTPPRRTLVVKGAGGRDVVQRWLHAHGLAVVEWNVYRRRPASPRIEGERIDAIIAASGDGLRRIGELWFAHPGDRTVTLLVPSQRVAGMAAALGFENVIVTQGAGAAAVGDALERLRDER